MGGPYARFLFSHPGGPSDDYSHRFDGDYLRWDQDHVELCTEILRSVTFGMHYQREFANHLLTLGAFRTAYLLDVLNRKYALECLLNDTILYPFVLERISEVYVLAIHEANPPGAPKKEFLEKQGELQRICEIPTTYRQDFLASRYFPPSFHV